jgi:hypothetical protein
MGTTEVLLLREYTSLHGLLAFYAYKSKDLVIFFYAIHALRSEDTVAEVSAVTKDDWLDEEVQYTG